LAPLLIFLGVLALIAVIGIGGVVYVGYQVKEKVTSVAEAVTKSAPSAGENKEAGSAQNDTNNVAGLLGNLGGMLGKGDDDGDPVESISVNDPVTPCSPAPYPAQSPARIPLQGGTVITTAWGIKNGDVETRTSVDSTNETSVVQTGSAEAYKNDDGQESKAQTYEQVVCNDDLASASTYVTTGGTHLPHILHGVIRGRLSSKSFEEAKSAGKTYLRYFYPYGAGDNLKPAYEAGLLTRAEPQDVPYPMIVNDQRVDLPVIHLAGIMEPVGKDPLPKSVRPSHSAIDVYMIDDPLDPLVLMWKVKDPNFHGGNFRIEVVKIDYKAAQPVNLVEKQLTEQKRAVTYGIYFDFNKDTIKQESEPVLKEIVQAMMDNPDWKLTVEGNTDNVGGDAYNLDLSKRRAAAVKEALVTQYHIAPGRLSTDGFGASHPVETNDTLEGRARNRRVELTRE
jgi:outer membrane protein OmpA-like peptidoglycan-associated protein